MNRLYDMPVMVIFMYNHLITFAIINRRPHLRDTEKAVLEKITLIKDISIDSPHRAHIEILFDLSINELRRKYGFLDFDGLHKAWQKTLDTKELNKQFYQKLFNWYLWALQQVKFPQMRPKEEIIADNVHQSESLIRLLTRLLFVWFMKEKRLINPDLFEQNKLKQILKNFKGGGSEDTIYYKAILQNLFFATLNRPIGQRKPIDKRKTKNPEYGDPLVYRYEDLYIKPENILTYFEDIPFLNGGLFDCLDQRRDADNPVEIRLDGFSTKKEKQPIIPDKLFFGEYNNIDLSSDYDDKKKNRLTVFGLIAILHQYKFTIEENTPVEEEVALDPELLGKVFENLLASYNPETKTTARKQTGSFYTPREIVNYMVDESLIAYLKNHVDDKPRLRKLFSYEECDCENSFNKTETEILLKAIDYCKILDPACGSGAFPMGVLQKMIHILHKLDPDNSQWFEMVINNFPAYMQPEVRKKLEKENWNYVRKLGIIQQCIYGVDIQPIATQIAKLRFFISLLVDQREKPGEDNRGYEPLPNLDFKIVTANTLIPAPASDEVTTGLFAGQTDPFFEEFDRLTGLYFSKSDPADKKELKNQIKRIIKVKCDQKIKQIESRYENADEKVSNALKKKHRTFIEEKEREVKLWKSYPNLFKYESVGFFELKYFFPRAKDGIDIIIGNPPWGANLSTEEKKLLKTIYSEIDSSTPNSFAYFIGWANRTFNSTFSYVLPDSFLIKDYSKTRFLIKDFLSEIVWYENTGIPDEIRPFVYVDHDVCVINVKKNKSEILNAYLYRYDNKKQEIQEQSIKQPKSKIILQEFDYAINLIAGDEDFKILNQIKKHDRLDEFMQCHEGIHTGNCRELLFVEGRKNDHCNPLFYGGGIGDLIDNYYSRTTGWFVDYRAELINKKLGLYASLRDERIFKNPKIYITRTGNPFKAFYDQNTYASNNFFSLQHSDYSNNNQEFLFFVLPFIISKPAQYFIRTFAAPRLGSTFIETKIFHLLKFRVPTKTVFKAKVVNIVKYIIILKKYSTDKSFFEDLINNIVYELYLPNEIKSAGSEIIKHLSNLPELKENWSDKKKLEVIEKVYKEFSDPLHPVSVAMAKMQEIKEVKIIEGRG